MRIIYIILSLVLVWIFLSSFSTDKDSIKFYEIGETPEFDTIPTWLKIPILYKPMMK